LNEVDPNVFGYEMSWLDWHLWDIPDSV